MKSNANIPSHPPKSFSLPRIRAGTHDVHMHTPLLNPHKSRWSISPKCLLPGHEDKQILYICINPECQQPTRLVCETCFYKNHEVHNENFLAIDEIKKGDIEKLRYWPFEFKFRKIFEFVTKHEGYINNMVQDINASFNAMAMRILSKIDKIRLDLLKSIDNFYIKETQKQRFSEKLKGDLKSCFELKKISQVVRQMFSKEIRHQIFLQKMNTILKDEQIQRNREILLKYFEASDKGSDMIFDKLHFLKKENWIVEQIEEQNKALKEQLVTIDETDLGIEKVVIQTLNYLDKHAQYPVEFDKRELDDGSVYTGFLSKGSRVLFGMRSYKNGFVYYGEWKNNARNGWGVLENRQAGYKYAGEWKEDRKHGFGRENNINWAYEGNYLADKKEGFGVWMQDGMRWEIGWKGDKKHGKGKIIDKTGSENEVYFLNGVESQMKSNKGSSPAFDLQELTKRFGSVKSNED